MFEKCIRNLREKSSQTIVAAVTSTLAILLMVTGVRAAEIGKPNPNFTLKSYSGADVSLADFKGKTVVLEWFNKGCPFVQKHYNKGDMQALQAKYAAQGVVWLVVNSTNTSHTDYLSPDQTKALIEEWKIKASDVLIDADGKIGALFAAKTTPHMFVIGPDGSLAYQGAIDDDSSAFGDPKESKNYVAAALDSVLSSKTVAEAVTNPYGCSVKYSS